MAMGETQVGIVHPCKAYGAMAVHRPLLLLGPADSHIAELIRDHRIGWQVDHGDVEGFIAAHKDDFAGMAPLLEELKKAERIYRNSVPDVTHNHLRLLTSGELWSTILSRTFTLCSQV